MKKIIVAALDNACWVVDSLPDWTYPFIGRFLGCPNGMAMWSVRLDERWQTGRWADEQGASA